MANLQKVNLGAIPDGAGGDDARTAFNRGNTNVDVLNSQAVLTSAQPVTAPQALTVAHVGKRVNINLAAAGAVSPPPASTCTADSVILLRNVGTTVVSLPPADGSGDTVALSKLSPGETALLDTDGMHAWTVLMRGRTNSDDEVVTGSLTVDGNEAVGGKLMVTGDTALANLAVTGNAALEKVTFPDGTIQSSAAYGPYGQCYLGVSGTGLLLSRKNGSFLTIQGIARQIPAAGVALAGAGTVANTQYWIYAYMSGATMTLEASTTLHTIDPASGVEVKSGDASRTLVGMAFCLTAGSWATPGAILALSYFNRKLRLMTSTNVGGQAQNPTVWVSIACSNWADEAVTVNATGYGSTPVAGNTSSIYLAVNGAIVGQPYRYSNNTGGFAFPVGLGIVSEPAEGSYTWSLYGQNDGQLLTMSAAVYVQTRG